MKTRQISVFCLLVLMVAICGCAAPRISIFGNNGEPLKEYTLQGSGKKKVLLIPVKGRITDDVESGLIRKKPSMVQEIVAQLKKAEKDKDVGAVLLVIDSPGGSVTASDVLYHEIVQFKEKTGRKVVASMMDVAASGGYYIALPADAILAHPTTITGSVGVLFLQPKVVGLMDKIGVDVQVSKSGANKDIGSPFRTATAQEKKILQEMTDKLARRFLDLVSQHRRIDAKGMAEISQCQCIPCRRSPATGAGRSRRIPKRRRRRGRSTGRSRQGCQGRGLSPGKVRERHHIQHAEHLDRR